MPDAINTLDACRPRGQAVSSSFAEGRGVPLRASALNATGVAHFFECMAWADAAGNGVAKQVMLLAQGDWFEIKRARLQQEKWDVADGSGKESKVGCW